MSLDQTAFKSALSRWASGVSVITASDGKGVLGGLTASSFTSVSLDPPLVLFCLAETATSFEVFRQTRSFAVHFLTSRQEALSTYFATSGGDKFTKLAYSLGLDGVPVLPDCLAVLECRVREKFAGGDHLIFLGEVESVRQNDASPLLFYQGKYHSI